MMMMVMMMRFDHSDSRCGGGWMVPLLLHRVIIIMEFAHSSFIDFIVYMLYTIYSILYAVDVSI